MGEAMRMSELLAHGFVNNVRGVFVKEDPFSVGFVVTGLGTISIKAGTYVSVAGRMFSFNNQTVVVMPGSLAAGTDYAIYACADGSVRADSNWSAPTGYTTSNSRKIGGFHYAPGGNAGGQSGGNSTTQINPYSVWDLAWRPSCKDPRGMTLVAGSFWSDIYLLGVNHTTDGTSRLGATIADGNSPPKVPLEFGGTGSNSYGSMTWFETAEVFSAYGKRMPTYQEFLSIAYGTTENTSVGSDPVTTQLQVAFTSKWGVVQASGVMWVWGDEFGGGAASAAWSNNVGGRGQSYQMENAVFFGGAWALAAFSGSRASLWYHSPSSSYGNLGGRGACDHLQLV